MDRRGWGWLVGAGAAAALALGGCKSSGKFSGLGGSHPGSGGNGSPGAGGTGGTGGGSGGGGTGGGGTGGGTGTGGTGGGVTFGGAGPWPTTNVQIGAADGIQEMPVVGISTDESQNLWVATHAALYLKRPTDASFHRYAAADGLHLQGNPVSYCDNFGDHACPILGGAADPGISEIVGGGPNEVFVGYYGNWDGSQDWNDPNRHTGKIDRVRLTASGLQVDRFDLVWSGSAMYWHNRTIERMIYDHFKHPHELYVGTNHGVDLIRPDLYQPAPAGTWFVTASHQWLSDHLHPRVCYHMTCVDETGQRMGDWRGLALTSDGNLWVAGRWTAGLIKWSPILWDDSGASDPQGWAQRPGQEAFAFAFGDPYPTAPNDAGMINQPVFKVPMEGDPVDLSAVTVAPDGRVWFASGPYYSGADDVAYGIASWDGHAFTYYAPSSLGLPEQNVRDLIALPDGRLAIAGPNSGLVLWSPATGASTSISNLLPSGAVVRMELDTMVNPPALHVATQGGAAVIRAFP